MLKKLKKLWQSNKIFKLAVGIFAGAGLGYAYYYFIGCNSGTCAITSNPVNSTAYGAVMGLLMTFPSKKGEKSK